MQTSTIQELKITVRLIHENKEIHTVEKVFGVMDVNEEKEAPAKTIDDIITEFLNEIQQAASEKGYDVNDESLAKIAFSLILSMIKQSESQVTFDIELEKLEVKKDASREETNT